MAQENELEAKIIPPLSEFATGQVSANQIRPVEFEDLLGREPVKLDSDQIEKLLLERVVLISGAGGSIGSELCRQIASKGAKRLVLVDHSEVHLFSIEQELIQKGYKDQIIALVGDVMNESRMRSIFETYKPEVVFHAAAYKHVPIMERQPVEALKNNTLGTYQLAQISSDFNVDRFVLISTDKAINPTSVMGASKRMAEIMTQAVQQKKGNVTKFMAVRFGNVLGSSGSVIPVFKEQISLGGPVTVTHPEVTRYFMTIPEAVGLVLQSATQGDGGEIFVLDMGESVKILDVARQLIRLSGFTPDEDIEIKFVGLRPGEKLFEELQHNDERLVNTAHERINRLVCEPNSFEKIQEFLVSINEGVQKKDASGLKQMLKDFLPEYSPFFGDR